MLRVPARQNAHASGSLGSRVALAAFVGLCLLMMAVPFVGMAWHPTTQTTENRELAELPSLVDDAGEPNVGILQDLGAYFDDRFAYRSELVTLGAQVRSMLGGSANDSVVVGGNEWLYYQGTLPDYLGQTQLSDRELANIAHNLRLVQDNVESHGGRFVFTIAPNKNTLFDANMPSNYLRSWEPSASERLEPFLAQEKVSYVNLFAGLKPTDSTDYFKRDTHWNNKGALKGANAILEAFGKRKIRASGTDWVEREDHTGDLAKMLYPAAPGVERNYYLEGFNDADDCTGNNWSFVSGSHASDASVSTKSAGRGSLMAYRDSFCDALMPYLSSSFASASYSKLVPYNMLSVADVDADCVLIERAERHVPNLARMAPIMEAKPVSDVPQVLSRCLDSNFALQQNGPFWNITGSYRCTRELGADGGVAPVFLQVLAPDGVLTSYEAFCVTADADGDGAEALCGCDPENGFEAYVPLEALVPGCQTRLVVHVGGRWLSDEFEPFEGGR